ncbi:MAG: hypothetical protein EOO99_11020 [Pedobacter sp.]|nr:MAG: hypothetical protein EOO99_11020 [Pedobacter sp.]
MRKFSLSGFMLVLGLITWPLLSVKANPVQIPNFLVKENLIANGKLALIAADSLDNPLDNIKGTYTFSISGFTQEIKFHEGVGIVPMPIDKSTFVYIKHENGTELISKLVYVYKSDKQGITQLKPITISRIWLFIIPAFIILLIFAFKRFIYIGIILLLVYGYLNYSNGLSFSTMVESFFDYLKGLI